VIIIGCETNLQLLSINRAPTAESSAMKSLLVLVQSVHIRGDFAAELAGDRLGGQVLGLCVLLIGKNGGEGGTKKGGQCGNDRNIFKFSYGILVFFTLTQKRHFLSVSDPDSLITDPAF
jgi:hypothetical protein